MTTPGRWALTWPSRTSATDGTSDVLAYATSALVIAATIWVLRREVAARRGA